MNPRLFENVFGGGPQRLVVGVEIVFGFFTRAPKRVLYFRLNRKAPQPRQFKRSKHSSSKSTMVAGIEVATGIEAAF